MRTVRAGAPSLTVVTFRDGRPAFHRDARPSSWKEAGGITGEAVTREDAWAAPLPVLAADDLAARLRASGRFSRVRRAGPGEASQTDLVLRARLRRLRGYQGYHVAPDGAVEIVTGFGEAFLDAIEIVDPRTGALRFLGQAGAKVGPGSRLEPFVLARRAWDEAAEALVDRIVADPLDRSLQRTVGLEAGRRGDLGSLLSSLPPGWEVAGGPATSLPAGWRLAHRTPGSPSVEAGCRGVVLQDPTRRFYQPQLGTYTPALTLWICPAGWRLGLVAGSRAPRFYAEVVGRLPGGASLFVLRLGKSSWPRAAQEILAFLGGEPISDLRDWIRDAVSPRPKDAGGRGP